MECLSTLVIVLVLLYVINRVGTSPTRTRRGLRELATRRSGTFHVQGVRRTPTTRFRYGETTVVIRAAAFRHGRLTTDVLMDWPDRELDLDVQSISAGRNLAPSAELPVLPVKNNEFNRHFVAHGQPEQIALTWLSDGVCWQLARLCESPRQWGLRLTVHAGTMTVQKPVGLRHTNDLDELTRLALELYDQAMLTRAEGIDFLNDGQAQVLEDPECQVCGEVIVGTMVVCRRCQTPHHRDCWEYNGKCAIYGCGETHYVEPSTGRIV